MRIDFPYKSLVNDLYDLYDKLQYINTVCIKSNNFYDYTVRV